MCPVWRYAGQISGRPRDPEGVAAPKLRGRGLRPIDDPEGVAAPAPGRPRAVGPATRRPRRPGGPGALRVRGGEALPKLRGRSPRPDATFSLAAALI